ncbi:hypothetical protein HOK76_04305 [archaeon]|nr:hypothetical protein [archaeon]
MKSKIALMFSGGVDSTMVAYLLAKKYDEILLLTYNNGYGHLFKGRTKNRFNELEDMFPGKFKFKLSSSKDLFEKITINNVLNEYKTHKSGFVWCLGCKLAMHTYSIIYCLENGIALMSDGSSKDTNEMVEQKEITVKLIRKLYKKYGISFVTPVYNLKRKEEIKKLKELKFNMGYMQIMDRFLGIQPKCLAGEIYYLPNILFREKPKHDDKQIKLFFKRKSDFVDKTIKLHLMNNNLKFDDQKNKILKTYKLLKKNGMLQY